MHQTATPPQPTSSSVEQKQQTVQDSLDAPEIDDKDIFNAVLNSYKKVAKSVGVETHKVTNLKMCGTISLEIFRELNQKYPGKVTERGDITNHIFLEIEKNGSEWILDATWQQFLLKKTPGKPSVIWVKKAELTDELLRLGIPKEQHYLWLDAM